MNEALAKAREKHLVRNRSWAIRHAAFLLGAVQENHVEVGGVTKLQAAKLAVGYYREAGADRFAVLHQSRAAMLEHQIIVRERERLRDDYLGDVPEMPADLVRGEAGTDVGRRHAQHMPVAEFTQRLHLRLQVVHRQARQPALQLGGERLARERCIQADRIHQFVEQNRVLVEVTRDPFARRAQLHELRQRQRIFDQQRQIHRAPADGLDEGDQARERGLRFRRESGGANQQRHEFVETFAAVRGKRAVRAARTQPFQQIEGCPGVGETGRLQHLVCGGLFERPVPERMQALFIRGRRLALRRGEYRIEVFVHTLHVTRERGMKTRPVGETHADRHAQPVEIIGRQHLGLLVADLLQAVFGVAQEFIRVRQIAHRLRRQVAFSARCASTGRMRRS